MHLVRNIFVLEMASNQTHILYILEKDFRQMDKIGFPRIGTFHWAVIREIFHNLEFNQKLSVMEPLTSNTIHICNTQTSMKMRGVDLVPGLIVNSCDHIGFCDETVRYGLD